MFIKREILEGMRNSLKEGKVVLLYGPRRTGKTTVLKKVAKELELRGEKILFVSGETMETQKAFSSESIEKLKSVVSGFSTVIIDEAQKIPNVGLNLKLIVDHITGVKIIASGSASFDLAQKVGEPLVGRKSTFHLFPISAKELIDFQDVIYYQENFENHLILGGYPELFSLGSQEEKIAYLRELVDSYLFKDIFEHENIKNHKKIRDLLTLLAFQVGKEVSLSKLSNELDIHIDTVYRFLDLLEKSFIIFNIRGFSRNLRKEITKTSKYYFYDNGVRNALINNFNALSLRNDVGELWENYVIIERIKKQKYSFIYSNNYFWRTYEQKEIDWVEEREGKLFGYEIKWGDRKIREAPRDWVESYSEAEFKVIDRENYLDFIA